MAKESGRSSHGHYSWRKIWGSVVLLLPTLVVLFEFFTATFGVVESVRKIFIPSRPPLVLVSQTGGMRCLKFAFENLPESFNLGEIHLGVIKAYELGPFSGDMAGKVFECKVNMKIPLTMLSKKKIVFPVGIQAKKKNDAAYVYLCPILSQPGRGEIQVNAPMFFSIAGQPIENMEIRIPEQGFTLDLSRPKNMSVTVVHDKSRMPECGDPEENKEST